LPDIELKDEMSLKEFEKAVEEYGATTTGKTGFVWSEKVGEFFEKYDKVIEATALVKKLEEETGEDISKRRKKHDMSEKLKSLRFAVRNFNKKYGNQSKEEDRPHQGRNKDNPKIKPKNFHILERKLKGNKYYYKSR